MRIWKYPFNTTDEFTLNVPKGGEVLSVQTQGGAPCLWIKVDPDNVPETRRFRIFGTGHHIPLPCGNYIGTYQEFNGGLVWHLFEVYS